MSKESKAKRNALPGVSLAELVEVGAIDEFFHLRESGDVPFRMTRHRYLPELPKRPTGTP